MATKVTKGQIHNGTISKNAEGSATEQKWCPGFQDLKISLGSQDFYGNSRFHKDFKISQRFQDFT